MSAAGLTSWRPTSTPFKQFLAGWGFSGPLWITEHGYPSDSAFQYDPGYGSGPAAQAAYLTASLPTLLDAGASEVFVTERDNLGGEFGSEGVLGGDVGDPPPADPQVILEAGVRRGDHAGRLLRDARARLRRPARPRSLHPRSRCRPARPEHQRAPPSPSPIPAPSRSTSGRPR